MFRGQFEHAMDAKGRVSLPARFREAMNAAGELRLVVTRNIADPCLDVFPMRQWEALEKKVGELPQFDPNTIKFRRRYVSAAVECDLDGQGRILIPPSLRSFARLEKAVQWAGMIDKAELWDGVLWADKLGEVDDDDAFLKAIGQELKL